MKTIPWSLVLFTLLLSMSAAAFWVSEIILASYARRFGWKDVRVNRLFFRALILGFSILSLALSFLHLGSPFRGLHALDNLKSSWLSREILFVVVFVAAVFLLILMDLAKGKPSHLKQVLVLLGGLAGFLVVLAMSRLYMLPTVPLWNHLSTPGAFFTSGLLLGGQLTAAGYSALFYRNMDSNIQKIRSRWFQKTLPRTEILILVLIGMTLLFSVLFFLHSSPSGSLGQSGPDFIVTNKFVLFIVRFFLSLSGAFILGAGLYRLRRKEKSPFRLRRFVYAGFVFLFLAEFLGRFLFYILYSRLGV